MQKYYFSSVFPITFLLNAQFSLFLICISIWIIPFIDSVIDTIGCLHIHVPSHLASRNPNWGGGVSNKVASLDSFIIGVASWLL